MLSIVKRYSAIAVFLGFLSGCGDPSARMAHHLALPEYHAKAVITEENYGATTPFVYKLYLCNEGEVVESSCGKEVLIVDKIDLNEVSLKLNNGKLIVSLPNIARIHDFSNFWYSSNKPSQQPVAIELNVVTNIISDDR